MNNKNVLTILNEEFENEITGEKVKGLTVIIDGKIKQIMDLIIEKDEKYSDYSENIKDSIFAGISNIIESSK